MIASEGFLSAFFQTWAGMMKHPCQRTVKLRWKRLLGWLRLKTTVYLSGVSTLFTPDLKDAPKIMVGFWARISTVYLTSSEVNSTPSLQRMPFRSLAVICV